MERNRICIEGYQQYIIKCIYLGSWVEVRALLLCIYKKKTCSTYKIRCHFLCAFLDYVIVRAVTSIIASHFHTLRIEIASPLSSAVKHGG